MNDTTTDAQARPNPEEVRAAIGRALERRASREARRIRVEVCGGEVILAGQVRSCEEKSAVLGAAGHLPGVLRVVDRLYVEPEL